MNQVTEALVALALFAVIAVAAWAYQSARLENADGRTVIYLDQLVGTVELRQGPVTAFVTRQSGNVHKDLGSSSDWRDALGGAIKTFNRAGIDSVMVRRNEEHVLAVFRAFGSHVNAEGTKVGGATVNAA